MDFETESEIETTIHYDFNVTNIKVSVKLPKAVSLDFVVDRCSKIEKPVYCRKATNNIVTFKYNNFTFVLFKSSLMRLAVYQIYNNISFDVIKIIANIVTSSPQ